MKPVKKIVATTGEYTNKSGETKKRYTQIGTLFERDDGSRVVKIETVPLGWNGWASLYDLDEKKQENERPAPKSGGKAWEPPPGLDDEIPF